MKKLVWVIAAITMLAITGCGSNQLVVDSHMNTTEGKILEVRDGNVLLLEISKERGGYEKGDRILVHYDNGETVDSDNLVAGPSPYVPTANDYVGLQFWPEEVTKKDGMDSLECRHVTKYMNE